jgi:Fe-S cluster assembly protein SufD
MTTATALPASNRSFDRTALDELLARPAPSWVNDRRRAAFERLESLGLPGRQDENWMRTDLRLFKPKAWGPHPATADAAQPDGPLPQGLLAGAILAGGDRGGADADVPAEPSTGLAGRLVAVDGRVRLEELDPALARQGVLFGSAERLLAEHGATFERHWFSTIDSQADWFAAMHAAFHSAGAVLYVPDGVRIAAPLHALSAISPGGVDTGHVLVVLGEAAEATVLTETAGGGPAGTAGGLHCGGTEIVVGRRAFLRMVNLQNWNNGVWHFARQKAVVHEDARLQWTLGALGSRLSQVAQDVALVGRGGHAQVNGVMFTEGRQQLVYNTLQHHEAPDCRSDLLYKGALQDRSRLVWRGMIKVDKIAQKTDGYQRNDNLMLSTEARADSIPGLEIEADDVRCTHGATSGRVDEEQIFYAQARGLSADEAARLVVAGFFQQVFDRITIVPVREALARAIGSRIRRVS